jgi:hypothetical protein
MIKELLQMHLKKLKTIFFILFLFPLSSNAASSISIINWQEESTLTSIGKNSEISIEAKAVNLKPNQFIKSFALGLGKGRNIKITKVICNRQPVDYSFSNNFLEVKFPQVRKNNDAIWINFAYEEKYPQINKFLRQEAISIPSFASGAKARVVINFPGSLESATLNQNITKNGNSFIYNNIVPQNGVQEIIKLTSAQDLWDATIRVKINSNKPLENSIVSMPIYFENAGQKVANSAVQYSIQPLKQYTKSNNNILEFNTQEKEIIIENKARISTGQNIHTSIDRDPKKYSSFTQAEYDLLKPVLDQIIQSAKYKNLPTYAKIGQFVHEYIKYDSSYINKLPKIEEILQNPVGVCTEYAKLYDALARIAKIPSIIVNGVACGEYSKCEGHAWNMIYVNNKWISVDPTWDLMSGIVSSSHVYFSDNDNSKTQVQYFGSEKTVSSKMDLDIKNITR